MDKKQTVFLSAILGIGSIMMLSFLIISASKANPDCVVSDDLTVTGTITAIGNAQIQGNLSMNSTEILDVTNLEALKIKAWEYCDGNGGNCHDVSAGWGSLSCTTVRAIGSADKITATCGAGYVRTGCSCYSEYSEVEAKARSCMPSGANSCEGWVTNSTDAFVGSVQVYAYCCKID